MAWAPLNAYQQRWDASKTGSQLVITNEKCQFSNVEKIASPETF